MQKNISPLNSSAFCAIAFCLFVICLVSGAVTSKAGGLAFFDLSKMGADILMPGPLLLGGGEAETPESLKCELEHGIIDGVQLIYSTNTTQHAIQAHINKLLPGKQHKFNSSGAVGWRDETRRFSIMIWEQEGKQMVYIHRFVGEQSNPKQLRPK